MPAVVPGMERRRYQQQVGPMPANRKRHRAMRRQGAFTLVELLVVFAVIGLLVGMLGPSLTKAMDRARYVRWLATSAQWSRDPDCVVNYSFEDRDYRTELWDGSHWAAVENLARACDADRFDPTDYDGILLGPRWTTGRWPRHKQALQFDGVNDFVIALTPDAVDFQPVTDDFTICVWVNFDRFAFGDCVFSKSQWGRSSQYTMYWVGSKMEADVGQSCSTYDSPVPKVGEWYCYTLVNRANDRHLLFCNGVPMNCSGGGSVSPEATPMGYLILGCAGIWWNRVGFHFRGRIDEFLVFKRAFSDADVQGFYKMGKP